MAKKVVTLEISGQYCDKTEYDKMILQLSLDEKSQNLISELFIEFIKLKRVPGFIFQMANLKILSLSDNNIAELEDKISDLKKLKYLYLDRNNLSTLPNLIGDLHNLKVLSLSNNNLTSIPESVKNLTELTELNLAGNDGLKSVPQVIIKLPSLKKLTLPNTIVKPPRNIGKLQLITPRSKDYVDGINTYVKY